MGSGSAATRSVADLVLVDDSFATLPVVVDEGRKVINNVERVANLFVTKAAYAMLLTIIIGIQRIPFPFLPRHLTLIGTFSIGLPGLFLALAPNVNLVRPGFIDRVLRFSIPAGAVAAVATWLAYLSVPRGTDAELAEARTLATITLLGVGLAVLLVVSAPLRPWKVGLVAAMVGLYAVVMAWSVPRAYFELDVPDPADWTPALLAIVVGGAAVALLPRVIPGLGPAERIRGA